MTKKTDTKETTEIVTATPKQEIATIEDSKASLGLIQASLNKDWTAVPQETRVRFVARLCNELQISPVLNPFRFHVIKGVTILYADRRVAALIGNANKVSTKITKEEYDEKRQILKIYVRAEKPDGTCSDEFAALYLGSNSGEVRANLEMKCLSKAKRRAILALVDLSIPDEDELEYLEKAALQNTSVLTMPQTPSGLMVNEHPIDIVEKEDVEEARLELMDKILQGDSKRKDFMTKFIAGNTNGKKLSELTYDECKSLSQTYDDLMAEADEKLADSAQKHPEVESQEVAEHQEEMFGQSKLTAKDIF